MEPEQAAAGSAAGNSDWIDSLLDNVSNAWAHTRNFAVALPDRTRRFVGGYNTGMASLHTGWRETRRSLAKVIMPNVESHFSLPYLYRRFTANVPRDGMGRLGFGFALASPFLGSYLAYSGLRNLMRGRYARSFWQLAAGSALLYNVYASGQRLGGQ